MSTLVVGTLNLSSTALTGVASQAEAEAGTASNKIMTPQRTTQAIPAVVNTEFNVSGSAPKYACRAWVNFSGLTSPGTINSSGNVSSVARNGTGDYTVNFTTALPDADYSIAGMSVGNSPTNVTGASLTCLYPSGTATYLPLTKTTTQVRLMVGNSTNGVLTNSGNISFIFFR